MLFDWLNLRKKGETWEWEGDKDCHVTTILGFSAPLVTNLATPFKSEYIWIYMDIYMEYIWIYMNIYGNPPSIKLHFLPVIHIDGLSWRSLIDDKGSKGTFLKVNCYWTVFIKLNKVSPILRGGMGLHSSTWSISHQYSRGGCTISQKSTWTISHQYSRGGCTIYQKSNWTISHQYSRGDAHEHYLTNIQGEDAHGVVLLDLPAWPKLVKGALGHTGEDVHLVATVWHEGRVNLELLKTCNHCADA